MNSFTEHLEQNVNWNKVMENTMSFIGTGARAHWDMLVFEHNKHQVEESKEIAKEMGFSWFRTKETDRWDTYTKNMGFMPTEDYQPPSYGRNVICEKGGGKIRTLFGIFG